VALSPALKETPFAYAFGSDLSRAVETAEAILKYHPISQVTTQRLREKYFGDAERQPFGTKVRNTGESFGDFRRRCIGWWKETVAVLMGENNISTEEGEDKTVHVLVVSHGGFIRVLLGSLVSDPQFRFGGDNLGDMPNTGVSIVEAVGVYDGRILMYGDDAHLEGVVENDGEVASVEDKVDAIFSN